MSGIRWRIRRAFKPLLRPVMPAFGELTYQIKDIRLTVDATEVGGLAYAGRSSHEEYASFLYDEIASRLAPRLVVDVGANYGFTGMVFAKRFPGARVVLVEPSPYLCSLIQRNFDANSISNYRIVQAICGRDEDPDTVFSINPGDSQDNRVVGLAGWKSIQVPTRTLSSIVSEEYKSGNVFLKIDTQGFEEHVFAGADDFLLRNDNWLVKTEFAPNWLQSQGTAPVKLLRDLIAKFQVTQAPARYRFKADGLDKLFSEALLAADADRFVAHIASLDADGLGWCDLLLRPKAAAP